MCPLSINLSKIAYPKPKRVKMVGDFHDYTLSNGVLADVKCSLRTENVNSCTAGVLNAGKKNFMFHAAPEMQPLNVIKDILAKQVENLRKSCDDVRGFICGGYELDTKDAESIKSFDLYNTIADTLDELGVKFMMMCGKQKGAPMENLNIVNNNLTVWSDAFKQLFKSKEALGTDDIMSALENHYQFVEIPQNQAVNVIDKFIQKTQHLVG